MNSLLWLLFLQKIGGKILLCSCAVWPCNWWWFYSSTPFRMYIWGLYGELPVWFLFSFLIILAVHVVRKTDLYGSCFLYYIYCGRIMLCFCFFIWKYLLQCNSISFDLKIGTSTVWQFVYEMIWSYFPELPWFQLCLLCNASSLRLRCPSFLWSVLLDFRFEKLAWCFLFNLLVMFLGQSRAGQNMSVSDSRELPVLFPEQIPGIRCGTFRTSFYF